MHVIKCSLPKCSVGKKHLYNYVFALANQIITASEKKLDETLLLKIYFSFTISKVCYYCVQLLYSTVRAFLSFLFLLAKLLHSLRKVLEKRAFSGRNDLCVRSNIVHTLRSKRMANDAQRKRLRGRVFFRRR